ncbi:MAG TPA: alpha/beta hydrolase domain-containing protein [Iamia sp.]
MRRLVLAALVVLVAAVGCSDDEGTAVEETTTTTTTAPVREIPDGPAATLTPLEGGDGVFLAAAETGPSLEEAGYEEHELQAAGTATSYASDVPLPADGRYDLRPDQEAEYATRVVVRRPVDPEDFNGTVVVEWLNVSGGADAAPDYTYMAEEILRGGYAWVGVSAQRIGIEGGPVAVETPAGERSGAGQGLKGIDPERYGDLAHPGDVFAYDIYSQVGRAARAAADGGPLDGLGVDQVLAVGESQSAFALTTYANGVQPLTGVYDGLLIHSRGGAAAPLGEPGGYIDIGGSLGGEPTPIRPDLDVPTMIVQTEGDVLGLLGYLPARQDDSETVRLWEIAGAAHADRFQVGAFESELGCPTPINRGQQAFVLRAALRHLATWAAGGEPPPEADRLEVDGDAYVLDDAGNVRGGVRTPVVDAPVEVLSGQAPEGAAIICALLGSTTPLPDETLGELYADADAYRQAYEDATDAAIEAGVVLADDRAALLADARDVTI